MAVATRENAPAWENNTRVNFVSGMTEAFGRTYEDLALTQDAFIPCAAAYDAAAKRHTLTPTQAGITLPNVCTVRFTAPADFSAGDKVYLAGAQYTPAYTDSADAVGAGAWKRGAVVSLSIEGVSGKVFVGITSPITANGTWTPTCAQGVISRKNDCIWRKLPNNLVYVAGTFEYDKGTSTDSIKIGGLPLAIKGTASFCVGNFGPGTTDGIAVTGIGTRTQIEFLKGSNYLYNSSVLLTTGWVGVSAIYLI